MSVLHSRTGDTHEAPASHPLDHRVVRARTNAPYPFQPLSTFIAPSAVADEIATTGDGNRVYYSTTNGEVWLFDRKTAKSTRVAQVGELWDITVAANRSSTRRREARARQHQS
jgi:DNA-binding beta-propeller fold protein YncE